MPLGDYLAGLAFAVVTWGGAGYAAFTLLRRRLPDLRGAPRFLAAALLFLAILIAVHVAPGVLGLLSPLAVSLTALAAAAGVSLLPAARATAVSREPAAAPDQPHERAEVVLAGVAVFATTAVSLAALLKLRGVAPDHVDALAFALPEVAEWIRSGSIWETGAFVPLVQLRTYPNTGDVLALAAVLPWSNDAFLRVLPFPLLAVTGVGIYAIGRELRAGAATAAVIAAVIVSARFVVEPGVYQLKPDLFMFATFTAGVLFLLRHVRTRDRSDLVLAGVGLGLAFGSRWYGVTMVFIVAFVWLAALLIARRPFGPTLRNAVLLAGVILATGGFWLLRNLAMTGNPLYPVKIDPLGVVLFDAPRDILTGDFGYSVLDRLDQPGFVRHELWPAYRTAFGLPGLLVAVGTAVCMVLALRAPRGGQRGVALALVAATLAVGLSYALLPGAAQGLPDRPVPGIVEASARWAGPAFLLAAAATAWAAGRLGSRARLALLCAGVAAVLVSLAAVHTVSAAQLAGGTALAALLGCAVWLWRRRPPDRERLRARATVIVGVATVAVALLALTGQVHQERYNDRRFSGVTPIVDWLQANAPAGRRIGLAGHWRPEAFRPTYALFGPRLENDVEYVGPIVRDQVRLYNDARPFRAALRRGEFDLLLVGRFSEPDFETFRLQRILPFPPEARWAEPAGFSEVVRDGDFVLLRRRHGA